MAPDLHRGPPTCGLLQKASAVIGERPMTCAGNDSVRLCRKFWARAIVVPGCWDWAGNQDRYGYAVVTTSRANRTVLMKAHRLSWEIHNGPVQKGVFVLHHCDNPLCVNPAHLFLGNHTDNMRDAARKGRIRNRHNGQTHCINGHDFTVENTYYSPRTGATRHCRACRREAVARSRQRREEF